MQDISKIYRTDLIETHALRALSLEVGEAEFVAVSGPSGSGKTTFLNIAGLLETFDSGSYELDGRDVSRLSDDARSRIRKTMRGYSPPCATCSICIRRALRSTHCAGANETRAPRSRGDSTCAARCTRAKRCTRLSRWRPRWRTRTSRC